MTYRPLFTARSNLPAIAFSVCLCAVLATDSLQAQIVLNADFDSGSLCLSPSSACSVSGQASSVNGSTVSLVGRDNFNNNQWKWIYFSASGVSGETLTFEIGDNFNTGAGSLNGHKMVYSYDQENWHFFDNNFRTSSQSKYTFHNDAAFAEDTVYVAYGLPYPYQRTVDHTNSIASSPWVLPTPAGSADLIVGQSPGGVDDIGRTITPKNLYGYKITDAEHDGPKQKIALISGVHSNETLGNFALEGLVDFLVSDDLASAQLRRYAEFYVYPMANPDGRFAGYNRSTVEVPTVDPNRVWNPPNYNQPGSPHTLNDIRQVGQAMRFDTNEDVDYLIDFHSTVNGKGGHFGFVLPEWQSDPFWLALLDREPFETRDASLITFTGAKFGRDVLNAGFSITHETQFIADENIDRFLEMGQNFGLAWHDIFHVPGDLNFDGQLDIADWLVLMAHAETDLSGLSEIERYARGDLTGNGQNSIEDFMFFKDLFEQTHGAGSFAKMLTQVPEPSTVTVTVLASIVLLSSVRHRRVNTAFLFNY